MRKNSKLFTPKSVRMSDEDRRNNVRQMSHKRFKAQLKAMQPDIAFDHTIEANLFDVSLGGIGICANEHIPAGIDLVIEIITNKEKFNFEGKVVWSTTVPSSGKIIKSNKINEMGWQMGIQISTAKPEDKQKLESLYETAI